MGTLLRLSSRQVTARPWDRFPSDLWVPCEKWLFIPAAVVIFAFSATFAVAWNFHFPTYPELLLWRIFSIYHAAFTVYGGMYYVIAVLSWHRNRERGSEARRGPEARQVATLQAVTDEGAISTKQVSTVMETFDLDPESLQAGPQRSRATAFARVLSQRLARWIAGWRNLSPDNDPAMTLKLRVVIPVTITCAIYIFGRMYFYVEDFVSLREQPVGVYITVNRFLPFMGGG